MIVVNIKCFECDNDAHEQHHVIPQSRGGVNTIPLCSPCHGKVHNIKRCDNLSSLIKEGLIKAKERGVQLGNPNGWGGKQRLGSEAMANKAKINDSKVLPIIIELRGKDFSYRKIAKHLNETNYKDLNNKKFSSTLVFNICKRN